MMDPGSYANEGSFSNLSASAPPFTVVCSLPRPLSTPLMELPQPSYAVTSSYNWLNSNPPHSTPNHFSFPNSQFDSNSSAYPTPTPHLSTDAILYPQPQPKPEPYYDHPSYVSSTSDDTPPLTLSHPSAYDLLSTSHVATSHATQWTGFRDGFADWQQSKLVQLNDTSSLMENYLNEGFCAPKGLSRCTEASFNIDLAGREEHTESMSTGMLDANSFPGENPKFMAYDYPTTSTLTCTSVVSETCTPLSSLNVVNTGNHQISNSSLYEKCSRMYHMSANDNSSIMQSSPVVVIRTPAKDTCSVKSVNTGSDGDDKKFSEHNSFTMKEPHPFIRTGGKVHFDASQLSFHLQQDDHNFVQFSSTKTEELPTNKTASGNAWDQFVSGKPGNQFPHMRWDAFNFPVDGDEAIGSVVDCAESLDNFNPAVDSPCWKGESVSPSSLEVSDAVTLQNMKWLHLQDAKNFPWLANDAIRISFKKPSENLVQHSHGCLYNHLTSLDRPSVATLSFGEGFDNDECVYCHTKSSHGFGVQVSDEIHELRKEYPLPNKMMDNTDLKPSHSEQHSLQEGKWTSEKHCSVGVSDADFVVNINDDPDDCSSHVPFNAVEHVLSSTPSAEDACSELTKSNDGESTSKMHDGELKSKLRFRMLVNTMHNLSELLLFHCSNDACELKEEDFEVFKDVITNLYMCIVKNTERMTSSHESLIPERATLLSQLQKGELEYKHVPKEKYATLSGKKEEKLMSSASVSGAADNITQAIKKILTENCPAEKETQPQVLLYKNLWLEAEASLCSVNYMARFHRMKIEMEKYSSEMENVMPENHMSTENLTKSKVSSDPYTTGTSVSSPKYGPLVDNSFQDSPILSTSKAADEVMARFHILNSRANNFKPLNTSVVEELSSSKVTSSLKKADKLSQEAKDSSMPDISIQNSHVSSLTGEAHNFESSVMARFHILKHRCEDPRIMHVELHQPDVSDLGCASLRNFPINEDRNKDKVFDVHTKPILQNHGGVPILQNHGANSSHEKSTMNELHLFVKDDPVIESSITNNRVGGQTHAGWYNSSSSDWEHVLKEELSGQNC